ncbi:MAG: DUF4139 domain-containing protein [Candidatus Latescibacteria bacterium]|nr:DUF4139 domain-containing protein [Candidatus Latescibacterota bacterium]
MKQMCAKSGGLRAAAAAIVLAAALPAAAADEPVVLSGAGDRQELMLTIYNENLALVREVRRIELPGGGSRLEFQDVPSQIEPRSLLVETKAGKELRLLEQNYEFDLISRDKILEKYVGREMAWLQEDGTRITGTLLGMAQGPVYSVDGQVVFEVPGRLALPELPGDLRALPTLVWQVQTEGAGRRDLDVTYLTRGVSWSADYVLQLAENGKTGDLQAWVSVDNRSGATYRDAQLMFLAGDVHQAPPPSRPIMYKAAEMAMAMDGGMVEETVSDYHLYTYDGRTTLKEQSVKQLSLFTAPGIKVSRHYRLGAGAAAMRRGIATPSDRVAVWHVLENREKDGLGLPLPAGVVRVYGRSASGARQLLGEDRIGHTPKNETVELLTGYAFDLSAERTQTDERTRGDRSREYAYRILLKNHTKSPVTVEVTETAGGDWSILESSLTYAKVDSRTFRFDVPVPADGETTLTYRVLVTW